MFRGSTTNFRELVNSAIFFRGWREEFLTLPQGNGPQQSAPSRQRPTITKGFQLPLETAFSNGALVVVTFKKPLKVAANEDAPWCFHIGMRPFPEDSALRFVAQTAGVACNDVSLKNIAGHFYQVSNKRRQVNNFVLVVSSLFYFIFK
jgi:hypothetical protein